MSIMVISHKYKYILATYPKSGCSVTRTLHLLLNADNIDNIDNYKEKHHGIHENFCLNKIIKYKNYYKILIYRNPYERFLSSFFNKICGIRGKKINQNIKQPYKLTSSVNSINSYLKNYFWNMNKDIHLVPQKIKNKDLFDEILNIKDIKNIFNNFDKKLNEKAINIINKYDINNLNTLKKEYNKEYENIDLFNYNFYTDKNNFIKNEKIPDYKYFLTENNKKLIRQYYDDDFY